MIGTIYVKINAQNPNIALEPLYAYLNSPSSVRIVDVPKKIGNWKITNVFIAATYPDGSTVSKECVLVGGAYVGTIAGSTMTGTSENGYSIVANGVDENGNEVTGYVLGKGEVYILDTDGSITVGETTYYLHMLSAIPENPRPADTVYSPAEGLQFYTGTEWVAFPFEQAYLKKSSGGEVSGNVTLRDANLVVTDGEDSLSVTAGGFATASAEISLPEHSGTVMLKEDAEAGYLPLSGGEVEGSVIVKQPSDTHDPIRYYVTVKGYHGNYANYHEGGISYQWGSGNDKVGLNFPNLPDESRETIATEEHVQRQLNEQVLSGCNISGEVQIVGDSPRFRVADSRHHLIIDPDQVRFTDETSGTGYTYRFPTGNGVIALFDQIPTNVSQLSNDLVYVKWSEISDVLEMKADEEIEIQKNPTWDISGTWDHGSFTSDVSVTLKYTGMYTTGPLSTYEWTDTGSHYSYTWKLANQDDEWRFGGGYTITITADPDASTLDFETGDSRIHAVKQGEHETDTTNVVYQDSLQGYATKDDVDTVVGNINTVIEEING